MAKKTYSKTLSNIGDPPNRKKATSQYTPGKTKSLIKDNYYTDLDFEELIKTHLKDNPKATQYTGGSIKQNSTKFSRGKDKKGTYTAAYNPTYYGSGNIGSLFGKNEEFYTRIYDKDNATPTARSLKQQILDENLSNSKKFPLIRDLHNISVKKDVDHALVLNAKNKILPSDTNIKLTQGRYNTAKVNPNLLNEVKKTVIRKKIDPDSVLALLGRESTLGTSAHFVKGEQSYNLQDAVSGWNTDEHNRTPDLSRFLADKAVPGIDKESYKQGINFTIKDSASVEKYLRDNPKVRQEFLKRVKDTPAPTQNSLDGAVDLLRKKGVKGYNPGDPDYTNKYNKDLQLVRKEKELQQYMKKPTKFAYGGTSLDRDTPLESVAKMKKDTLDSLYLAQTDPTVSGLNALGGAMTSIGSSILSSGVGSVGGMGNVIGLGMEKLGGKPYIKDLLPGAEVTRAAMGGTTGPRTEVEGQEVFQTPDGQVGKFFGPSHENGGIKTDLPQGTDIYSKRVKINGVKMADRKILREKQLAKIEKLLAKSPMDPTLKRTYAKLKANTEILDQKDMMIQNTLNSVQKGVHALGGTVDDNNEGGYIDDITNLYQDEEQDPNEEEYDGDEDDYTDDYTDEEDNQDEQDYETDEEDYQDDEEEEFKLGGTVKKFGSGGTSYIDPITGEEYSDDLIDKYYIPKPKLDLIVPQVNDKLTSNIIDSQKYGGQPLVGRNTNEISTINTTGSNNISETSNSGSNIGDSLGNYSVGDLIGMGGSMYGAFAGKRNTVKNRAGDTPNINPYKNYGQRGLNTLDKAFNSLAVNKADQEYDLNLNRNNITARNNNSARGANTLRALNLASDATLNNASRKLNVDYTNRMTNLFQQKSNLENQQDARVMQGEGMRDMNDRRDRDSFYTQLGLDEHAIATGMQQFGKQLNTGIERQMTADALSNLSQYFDSDITIGGYKIKNKKKK